MGNRAALLIHCSKDEAEKIREMSKLQRRTISGCVLFILMRAVQLGENLIRMRAAGIDELPFAHVIEAYGLNSIPSKTPSGPRTTMLLWSSKDEAKRIRIVAAMRGMTISRFVLHTLGCSWRIADAFPKFTGTAKKSPKRARRS